VWQCDSRAGALARDIRCSQKASRRATAAAESDDTAPAAALVHAVSMASCMEACKKGKGSPYSIAESRVPELIPALGSQPAGEVSHKPCGRLPLLSARPAVAFPARRPVPISLLGEQRHDGCEQFA